MAESKDCYYDCVVPLIKDKPPSYTSAFKQQLVEGNGYWTWWGLIKKHIKSFFIRQYHYWWISDKKARKWREVHYHWEPEKGTCIGQIYNAKGK